MDAASAVSDLTFLIFELDGHRYALHASAVEQRISAALPARLAQGPGVIEGALSIRGRIAAVLDMRVRFALPRAPARTLATPHDVGATAMFARAVVALGLVLLARGAARFDENAETVAPTRALSPHASTSGEAL